MSDISIKIGGDCSAFNAALRQVRREAGAVGGELAKSLAMPTGIAATVGALGMLVKQTLAAGDAIADGSERLGLSRKEYQELSAMAELSGSSIEDFGMAFKGMSQTIADASSGIGAEAEKAKEKLGMIGLTIDDLQGKSPAQQFEIIAKAIGAISDPAARTTAAVELFGKSGMKLAVLGANFDDVKNKVEELGGALSDSAVNAADKFNDSLSLINRSLQAIVADSGFLEFLAETAEKVAYVVNGADKLERLQNKKGVKYDESKGAVGSNVLSLAGEMAIPEIEKYLAGRQGIFDTLKNTASAQPRALTKLAGSMFGGSEEVLRTEGYSPEILAEEKARREKKKAAEEKAAQVKADTEAKRKTQNESKTEKAIDSGLKDYFEDTDKAADKIYAAEEKVLSAIKRKNEEQAAYLQGKGEEFRLARAIEDYEKTSGRTATPEKVAEIQTQVKRESALSSESNLKTETDKLLAQGMRVSGNEVGARLYEEDQRRVAKGESPMDMAERGQMAQVFQGQTDIEQLKGIISAAPEASATDRLARVGGYVGGNGAPSGMEAYARQQTEIQKSIASILQNMQNSQTQTAHTQNLGFQP